MFSFVFCVFVILVVSEFGFEGWIWVLIDSVPDLCILLTFTLAFNEHNQTSWKEFIGRNINVVLQSKIKMLYPRWPLPVAVIAGYSSFS